MINTKLQSIDEKSLSMDGVRCIAGGNTSLKDCPKLISDAFFFCPEGKSQIFRAALPSKIIIYGIAILNVIFFTLIIASLFLRITLSDTLSIINDGALNAIKITFGSITISIMLTVLIGIPTAYLIARKNNKIYKVIDIISVIPIIIPPSVAGLALLMTFGRKGILSQIFSPLNINPAFTFWALIIVQIFIMMPIFIQIMKNGFKSIDKEIEEAAIIAGAGDKALLFHIYLPLSSKVLLTAVILCCLRAAGEFGATIMFAGNLVGKTQTLTTAIYTLSQQNIGEAVSLSVILIILFLIPMLFLKLVLKE
jgi:molybdate transport system permease protein